jgi:hypothetical protein
MLKFSACVVAIYKEPEQRQISPLGLQVKYMSKPLVSLVLNIFTPVSYFFTRISGIQKFLDSIIVRKLSVEMPKFIRKSVPSGGAVKGRIPGTPDFGITEALQNYYSTPALTGAGFGRAMQNIGTYFGGSQKNITPQNLPARLPGMTGDRRPFRPTYIPNQQDTTLSGPTPIVLGTRDGVTADPTQSDQYRAELSRYMNTVAGPSKEQLGLQIWAQANPGLAAKLKPGQSGYEQSTDYFNNRYRDYGDMPPTGAAGAAPLTQMPLEGQQPVQMTQPEMEGVAPESTNDRVQNFLRMLTEVGQGQ